MSTDPYHGHGGTYRRDPVTGERTPLVPATAFRPPCCMDPLPGTPAPGTAPEPAPPDTPDPTDI